MTKKQLQEKIECLEKEVLGERHYSPFFFSITGDRERLSGGRLDKLQEQITRIEKYLGITWSKDCKEGFKKIKK